MSFSALMVACNGASIDTAENGAAAISAGNWCISGGPIYTSIDSNPMIEAVAVKDGEITYAGKADENWCRQSSHNR